MDDATEATANGDGLEGYDPSDRRDASDRRSRRSRRDRPTRPPGIVTCRIRAPHILTG